MELELGSYKATKYVGVQYGMQPLTSVTLVLVHLLTCLGFFFTVSVQLLNLSMISFPFHVATG